VQNPAPKVSGAEFGYALPAVAPRQKRPFRVPARRRPILVFKDEEEAAGFAEGINARSKGDPNEQIKSMSVREFAREAGEPRRRLAPGLSVSRCSSTIFAA
jgi:hypothetical protein